MIDRPAVDVPSAPLEPSRRDFVRSIGLLPAAILPTWIGTTPPTQNIVLVDGWILAPTDFH
jgi:hypothetical protein